MKVEKVGNKPLAPDPKPEHGEGVTGMPESLDYKKAGLDLEKYAETMAGIQPLLTRTWPMNVIRPPFKAAGGKGGSFASLFDLDPNKWLFSRKYKNPVLVTCTDGVGSKLKIASLTGR